ncbi:uncharacterized protein EV422DRAFT_617069 [Fimicolochytrium jonesii]|uniref:uncharacterized protein n=1 Tax=Fimicolochytrium jonesii TaxID=1396493 RepID=UPI0022FF10A9|nr:uncharacterized protein EV422DRAFT_617069 [Fimicolochytrium jonesii]KAI8826060.1 hypothetical protein EV422DRAFT_617069 [Fimicolochytrium jonesii]
MSGRTGGLAGRPKLSEEQPRAGNAILPAMMQKLKIENEDLRKRLEESEAQLITAATVGKRLLEDHEKLRNRLKEVEGISAGEESDSSRRRTSIDRLRDIEQDADALSASFKDFMGKLSPSNSPEMPRRKRSSMESIERSHSLLQRRAQSPRRVSKKGFNKPQSPRRLATKPAAFIDTELASDIDNHLIYQVRALRHDLGIAQEQNVELHDRIATLEAQLEGVQNQHQKDSYLIAKQEEKLWDMELQNQQFKDQIAKSEADASRMLYSYRQLDFAYRDKVEELEALRNANDEKEGSFDNAKAKYEGELTRSQHLISTLESEKAALARRCTDIYRELEKQSYPRSDSSIFEAAGNATPEPQVETEVASETPTSDPDSPERSPSKPNFFMESLSSSLAHAHQQISDLETTIAETLREKDELLKLLAEAQEAIECVQGSGSGSGTPLDATLEEVKGKLAAVRRLRRGSGASSIRSFRSSRIRAGDQWGASPKMASTARNLLKEFSAIADQERDAADQASSSALEPLASSTSDLAISDLTTSSERADDDMPEERPEPVAQPPLIDDVFSSATDITVAEVSSKQKQHSASSAPSNPDQGLEWSAPDRIAYEDRSAETPKENALAAAAEIDLIISGQQTAESQSSSATDLLRGEDTVPPVADAGRSSIETSATVRRVPAPAEVGRPARTVRDTSGKLMVVFDECLDRTTSFVLCMDSGMQTVQNAEDREPLGEYTSPQSTTLRITQLSKTRDRQSDESMPNLIDHATSADGVVYVGELVLPVTSLPRATSQPAMPSTGKSPFENPAEPHARTASVPTKLAIPSPSGSYLPSAQRGLLNRWGTPLYTTGESPLPWPLPPSTRPQLDEMQNESPLRRPQLPEADLENREVGDVNPGVGSVNEALLDRLELPMSDLNVHLPLAPSNIDTDVNLPLNQVELDAHDSDSDSDDEDGVFSIPESQDTPTNESVTRLRRFTSMLRTKGSNATTPTRRRAGQHDEEASEGDRSIADLLRDPRQLASMASFGSSAVFSETSEMSRDEKKDKRDKAIHGLTHTMVGSWFQKFNRHNKNPKLRYFWVNPYSRGLNWAPKPPSQGKKKMQTKTVFIVSLKWKEPDHHYRNYPPGPEHAISIVTPHREVKIVPTNWTDHELWIHGLSLLLKRTHSSKPLYEQFGMRDDEKEPVEEEEEIKISGPIMRASTFGPSALRSADYSQSTPVLPFLPEKSVGSDDFPVATNDAESMADQEMTLEDLGGAPSTAPEPLDNTTTPRPHSIPNQPRIPTTTSTAGPTPERKLLRRNSLWNSMSDLPLPRSRLPRPGPKTPTAQSRIDAATPPTIDESSTRTLDNRTPRPAEVKRMQSFGDMLLRRRSSFAFSLGSNSKQQHPPLPAGAVGRVAAATTDDASSSSSMSAGTPKSRKAMYRKSIIGLTREPTIAPAADPPELPATPVRAKTGPDTSSLTMVVEGTPLMETRRPKKNKSVITHLRNFSGNLSRLSSQSGDSGRSQPLTEPASANGSMSIDPDSFAAAEINSRSTTSSSKPPRPWSEAMADPLHNL